MVARRLKSPAAASGGADCLRTETRILTPVNAVIKFGEDVVAGFDFDNGLKFVEILRLDVGRLG
jgi:hypothetical protein